MPTSIESCGGESCQGWSVAPSRYALWLSVVASAIAISNSLRFGAEHLPGAILAVFVVALISYNFPAKRLRVEVHHGMISGPDWTRWRRIEFPVTQIDWSRSHVPVANRFREACSIYSRDGRRIVICRLFFSPQQLSEMDSIFQSLSSGTKG